MFLAAGLARAVCFNEDAQGPATQLLASATGLRGFVSPWGNVAGLLST